MNKNLRIRFQGKEYLLIGDLVSGGPIATKEQFENFECSYAQLVRDGRVMRFRDSIGHRDEIEVLGDDASMQDTGKAAEAIVDLLDNGIESWRRPSRKLRAV